MSPEPLPPPSDPGWLLTYDGFDAGEEPLREALCALGNGVFVTRGAAEESSAGGSHYPGTYLAGGYNRLVTRLAGRDIVQEDLVNLPNWLPLDFRPEGGEWLDLGAQEVLEYRQVLDMGLGLLTREVVVRDARGRETEVVSRRIVHMGEPHLAAISYAITPRNWSGRIEVRSGLDGSVTNAGVARYRDLASTHLETVAMGDAGGTGIWLLVRTTQSRLEIAMSACTRVWDGEREVDARRGVEQAEKAITATLSFGVTRGRTRTVEKIVALYTSRDGGISEAALEAREALARCGRFATLVRSHAAAWRALWGRSDVEISPTNDEQRILRLHIFHMLQTTSLNKIGLDVSVPARGWHGEAYRGHIFWDELFVFPFYNLRFPMITRSLLLYRYRRLNRARWAARREGYRGAMFPWQSASNGQEETQEVHLNPRDGTWGPDLSRRQRHVNVAIAHNIWQYYVVTGDREFMSHWGAEMLLEIARFLDSLATFSEISGRYEIHGVMGPDEYSEKYPGSEEPGLRNNTYTNVMAVWVLERALELLETLPPRRVRELAERIGLGPQEPERWRDVTRRMLVPFHADGVISQFEGYEGLLEFDWVGYRQKHGDINRLDRILKAEGDSPDRYRMSKQADVLMLYYLLPEREVRRIIEQLGYPYPDDTLRRAVDFYLPRTSHGSTLSYVVHASVMDRIERDVAWEMFKEALLSDVDDRQGGTTPEGIHLGAMGGTVDIVSRHYAGIDTTGRTLAFWPRLPAALDRVALRMRHRGQWFGVEVTRDRFRLELEPGGWPAEVEVLGRPVALAPGEVFEAALADPDPS
ncbi:MAG: glycoside hydrolase family 65 protein [Thermoleophilia bacterium]|nr:glycoside hydrolase family 65 protein [Thermoleophilia bacterium]